jgi:hypothetical protein
MSYDLHIARSGDGHLSDSVPIALVEWCAAVAATEGVRLLGAHAQTVTNPATGEIISLGSRNGDAEVFFPEEGEWYAVFRWQGDSAAFGARFEPGDMAHPVWCAAVALATRLGAAIRGDEGETYYS